MTQDSLFTDKITLVEGGRPGGGQTAKQEESDNLVRDGHGVPITLPPVTPTYKTAPKGRKRVRDTSIEAWLEVLQTLPQREKAILQGISQLERRHQSWPTAYEIKEEVERDPILKKHCPVFDINSIRPILTAMKDLGMVEFTDKRKCKISTKKVYTWKLPQAAQDYLWKEHPNETATIRN